MTEPELLRRFDQALTDIAQLAEAIGEQHWKQAFFDRALQTLANESLPERERLQLVCEQTHVFGGMGSWNDSPPLSTDCSTNLKRLPPRCMKYVRWPWYI